MNHGRSSLFAGLLAALVLAAPAKAAFDGPEGPVVFANDNAIQRVEPIDGTLRRPAFRAGEGDWAGWTPSAPAVSPDGRSIAFAAGKDCDGCGRIAIVPLDGSAQPSIVAEGADLAAPSWSADGQELVYSAHDGLYRVNVPGGAPQRVSLPDNIADPRQPAWSPDGSRLAFSAVPAAGGVRRIYIRAGSGAVTPLTGGDVAAEWPSWSPEAERIAYVAEPGTGTDPRTGNTYAGFTQLLVRGDDGRAPETVYSVPDHTYGVITGRAAFSPSGDRVAFAWRYPDYHAGCFEYLEWITIGQPGVHESTSCNYGGSDGVDWGTRAGTGAVSLLSGDYGSKTAAGNGASSDAIVSGDGRYVVFTSRAWDLVPDLVDNNEQNDVFRRDLATGDTVVVSVKEDGKTPDPGNTTGVAVSRDGRWIAFSSTATDLVSGREAAPGAVYLRDMSSGTTTLVSRLVQDGKGIAGTPLAISDDGAYVLFAAGDGPIFRFDRAADRADRVDTAGAQGRGFMTPDGRYVAFGSVAGVFRRDMSPGGDTQLVAPGGDAPEVDGLSDDGSTVLWRSKDPNVVPGFADHNDADSDLYIRRLGSPARLVTGADGSPTEGSGGSADSALLSADGKTVVFTSDWLGYDAQAVEYNGGHHAHVWARRFDPAPAGKAQLAPSHWAAEKIAGDGDDTSVAVSADGRYVLALTSSSTVVDPPVRTHDLGVLVRYDRETRETIAVSALGDDANGADVGASSLSRDGRVVAFTSNAGNLVKGFQDNHVTYPDTFAWHERSLADSDSVPPEVTLTTPADGAVYRTGRLVLADYACSDEGGSALAACDGTVPPGQPLDTATPGVHDFTVTARDGAGNVTTKTVHYRVAEPNDRLELATRRAGGGAAESADRGSWSGVLSADGRYLVFDSRASDLVPGFVDGNGGVDDVFRRDLQTGETQLVSGTGVHGANGLSHGGDASWASPTSVISSDGRYVLFESYATDLIDGFTGGRVQPSLFLRDMRTGEIRLVDHALGNPKQASDGGVGYDYRLSRDGSTVVFRSSAKNLVAGVTSGRSQIYAYDVATGTLSSLTGDANGDSGAPDPSGDGRRVVFWSGATNLLPGHTIPAGGAHMYWHDRVTGVTRLVDHRFDSDTTPSSSSDLPRLSLDGRVVMFESSANDVIAGLTGHEAWNPDELYTRDMVSGGPARLVTAEAGDAHHGSGGKVLGAVISDDGATVVWQSRSSRAVAGFADHNGDIGFDAYMRHGDEPARLAVHGPEGAAHGYPLGVDISGLSGDGRLLAFTAGEPGSEGPMPPPDVRRVDLLRDRVVSVASAPDAWVDEVQLSADGQRISLDTNAQNLVDGFADGNGGEDSDIFTWGDRPPVAKASSRVTGPLTVRLDASASSDPDGRLVDYRWDFGDGGSGTGKTVTHTYAAEGTYTVTLTVEDDGSHTASTTLQVIAIKGVLAADGAPFDFLGVDRSLACNAVFAGGSVACGTFAAYGGVVYGPPGMGATAFTPVGQEVQPGHIVTTVALGSTGVRLRQTDAYRAGEGFYRTDVAVVDDGDSARAVTVYRAAKCALGAPAARAALHDSGTAMAGCAGGASVAALLPLTPGARHQAGAAAGVLGAVAAGAELSNACDCAPATDPGAAISWSVTVPAHGELSRGSLASFGPAGSIPLTVAVTPEHDTAQPLDDNALTVTLRNPNAGAATAGGIAVTPDAWDYIAGSASGLTTADPATANGRLSWSGDWSMPGHGDGELRFRLTHRAGERLSTTTASASGGRFAGVTSTSLADLDEAKASVDVRSAEGSVPNTAIYGGPAGPTSGDSPSFELVASKANVHYECRWGSGDWSECATPFEPGPLRDGDYTLEVRAVDAVGADLTPATRAFTVDTIAPYTTIASGPRAVTTDPRPAFELRANEPGARFECRFAAAWQSCATPYHAGLMADGGYEFAARAIDAAGNADPTPATWAFEIDTTPPVTVIDGLDGEVLGAARSSVAPSTSGAGGGKVAVGGDGAATIEVACPADAGGTCAGSIGLAASPKPAATASAARAAPDGAVPLARADFEVAPGHRATVRIPLPMGVRNTVDRDGRMPVFVTLDLGGGPVRGDDLVLTPDPRTARLLDAGRELKVVSGKVTLRLRCAARCSGSVAIGRHASKFAGRRMKVRVKVGQMRGTQSVRITTKPALSKRLSVTLRAKEARR